MKIEKEVVVKPMTTDGLELQIGDKCLFNAWGRCHTGIYKGIASKGAVMFEGMISEAPVTFNVMPSSIDYIKKV